MKKSLPERVNKRVKESDPNDYVWPFEISVEDVPAVMGETPTPHRSPPNMELPQRPSLMAMFVMFAPKGGSPWDGNRAPGEKWTEFNESSQRASHRPQITWCSEHVCGFFPFLPFGPSVLEPHLKSEIRNGKSKTRIGCGIQQPNASPPKSEHVAELIDAESKVTFAILGRLGRLAGRPDERASRSISIWQVLNMFV